eukprot:bmy_01601T0
MSGKGHSEQEEAKPGGRVEWGLFLQTPGTGPQDSTTTACPLVAARSFDLEKSDDMLRKHVKFRKQQDLHNILAWQPPEVVRLYNANGICGHDSEGSPVWYHIIRGLDLRGLLLSVSRQELLRAEFQSCELLLQESSKLFPVAFNLIKPYITEEMRRKVVIPGDNWKQELPKFISPDQLPVEFGGTMADPDGNPKCLTKINYGGKVPRSYYLRNQVRVQYEHQVTVGRGSSLQVENEILFPGCVLRWQFSSDEADIGFGVFLKTKTGER